MSVICNVHKLCAPFKINFFLDNKFEKTDFTGNAKQYIMDSLGGYVMVNGGTPVCRGRFDTAESAEVSFFSKSLNNH